DRGYLDGEACLADTSRAGEGHQPRPFKKGRHRGDVVLPPDDLRQRRGQWPSNRRGLDPSPCQRSEVTPAPDVELPQERGDVALDGADRDVEAARDLSVRQAIAERGEDLGFSRRDGGCGAHPLIVSRSAARRRLLPAETGTSAAQT